MSDLTETSPSIEVHGVVTSLMKGSKVASGVCGLHYPHHTAANVVHAHSTFIRVECIIPEA